MSEMDHEDRHCLREHDFAIPEDFEFGLTPVGLKFFNVEDELGGLGLETLESRMTWCQMLLAAQDGSAFQATAENHKCEPGIFLMGHCPLMLPQ